MSGFRPVRPTGSTPEALFDQWSHENQTNALKINDSSGMKVSRTTRGFILQPKRVPGGSPATSITVKRLSFKQSLGDYFLATELSTGTVYQVAKPYKLRNSIGFEIIYGSRINFSYPHNPAGGGLSADTLAYLYRKAVLSTDNTRTENQGIVPQYLPATTAPVHAADVLYAVQMSSGTGVVSDPLDVLSNPGTPIVWLDLNVDGRAWTRFSVQTFGT